MLLDFSPFETILNDFSAMPAPQMSNDYSIGEMKLGSMLKPSIGKFLVMTTSNHDLFLQTNINY